jgi:hypothetical protein
VTVASAIRWEDWAPPLSPPADRGLDRDVAEQIAAAMWASDPHCAAAEMWEAYAATLPPSPSVSAMSTGSQSVAYAPAGPSGDYGLALARAAWHRSFCDGQLQSVPLESTTPAPIPWDRLPPWWVVEPDP